MERAQSVDRRSEARRLLEEAAQAYQGATDVGGVEQAVARLMEALAVDPRFWEVHWYLASAWQALGDYARAVEHYQAAVRLEPAASGDASAAAYLYGGLSDLCQAQGRVDEARRYYQRYLGLFPLAGDATWMARRLSFLAECGGNWLELYQDAAREQAAGHHETALGFFREALAQYPTSPFLHVGQGLSERGLGRYDDAVRALETACELDPDPRSYVEMGATYGQIGNSYVEEGFYARALEVNPDDALALFHLGSACFSRRDRAAALEHLEKALELSPHAPWAARARAFVEEVLRSGTVAYPDCLREPIPWTLWSDEDAGMVVHVPENAMFLPPLDPHDLLLLTDNPVKPIFKFRLRRVPTPENHDVESFIRMQERAWQLDPDVKCERKDRITISNLPALCGEFRDLKMDAMTTRAFIFRDAEIFEVSCTAPWVVYQRGLASFEKMIREIGLLGMHDLYVSRKKRSQAIVARDPNDLEALARLGAAHIGLNELEGAQEVYQHILNLAPDHPQALGDLGLCYWKLDRVDLAIKALERAVESHLDPEIVKTLGMAYERKGRADRAVKLYLRSQEARPDRSVRLLLGAAYESLRKHAEAEKEYRGVLGEDPSSYRARMMLGALLRKTKRGSEAIPLYKEAADLDPGKPDALLMMGICYTEEKYWDMAEKALHKVLRLDFDNQAARDALETLGVERKKQRRY